MSGPRPSDPCGTDLGQTPMWGGALDDLAAAVFGTTQGQARIAPLLARWEHEVGPLRDEDPDSATWQAMRTDWALCDAAVTRPGDTWAWRAARGGVPGIAASPVEVQLAQSIAGLWFVTPGRRPWLCDALSGVGVALSSSLRLLPAPGGKPPAALWEARIVVIDGAAQLCRPPLSYPLDVADEVRRRGLRRLAEHAQTRHDALMQLRRKLLHWSRAPRADARLLFTR